MNVQDKTSNRSEAAKFGGFQFTYELELCFESATDVLGELLNLKVQELAPSGFDSRQRSSQRARRLGSCS
jgi:hypothetical protein